MLRFIQQGFHKVIRGNQARGAPCQKGASTEHEDGDGYCNIAQFSSVHAALAATSSHPLYKWKKKESKRYSDGTRFGTSSNDCHRHQKVGQNFISDALKGAVIGTGYAVFKSVHGYCSGRKDRNNENVPVCPYQKCKTLTQQNLVLKVLSSLFVGDLGSKLCVLPDGYNRNSPSTFAVDASKEENDSLEYLQRKEYEEAKFKVKCLADKLNNTDENYSATDHFRALQAWADKDYSLAISLWQRTVDKIGTPIAANRLGACYEHGYGVRQDYKQAYKYYSIAANHGCGLGLYNLAMLQINGFVEPQVDSLKLLKQSAALNNSRAQTYLGSFYFTNNNKNLAVKYFEKAAKNNDADALYYLGICHENGSGVSQPDDRKAFEYYRLAAEAGHSDAQYNLAVFYEEGYGGLEMDKRQALYWYKKAAEKGNTSAKEKTTELGGVRCRSAMSWPALSNETFGLIADTEAESLTRTFSDNTIQVSPTGSITLHTALSNSSISSASSGLSMDEKLGKPKFFIDDDELEALDDRENSFSDWSESTTDSEDSAVVFRDSSSDLKLLKLSYSNSTIESNASQTRLINLSQENRHIATTGFA